MACHPSMQSDYSITRPTLINNLGRPTKIVSNNDFSHNRNDKISKTFQGVICIPLSDWNGLMNQPKNIGDNIHIFCGLSRMY